MKNIFFGMNPIALAFIGIAIFLGSWAWADRHEEEVNEFATHCQAAAGIVETHDGELVCLKQTP